MLKVVCLVEHTHRRSVDTNLVEIHAEMSELLDKQVYVLNECSNRNSGIHGGGHANSRKVCDENKRKKEKKRRPRKNFYDDRKDFVWLLLKLDITNVDKLQDNNSPHTKGTICLVNG